MSIRIVFGLACFAMVVACTVGCHKSASEGITKKPRNTGTVKQSGNKQLAQKDRIKAQTGRSDCISDFERLQKLTDRLNKVNHSNYTVAFGSENNSDADSPWIYIDYALFDRLNDDAVAAMIADTMATKSILRDHKADTLNNSIERVMQKDYTLQTDRIVGHHLAAAGFGAEGFGQWLQAKNLSAIAEPGQNHVLESKRIKAFTQGFLTGSDREGDKQVRQ